MIKRITLSLLGLLAMFHLAGQTPGCSDPDQPASLADSCSNAVFLCGNYLDGYCSSTNGLQDDTLGSWTFEHGGFLRLSPCSDTLVLAVQAWDCSDPDGLQARLFSGDCMAFDLVGESQVAEGDSVVLLFTGLSPDSVYFLVLDGAMCDFTIHVLQGMGTAAPGMDGTWACTDGFIDGPSELCPGDLAQYTVTLPICAFTPGAPVGGDSVYCPPPPAVGCGQTDSVRLVWHIPEATMFVGDSTGTTIQITVDTALSLVDTLILDSIWVEWQVVPPGPVDSLVFCDCPGGTAPGGVIPAFPVTIWHSIQYEFCELTCLEPICEINGVIYTQSGTYIQEPDNCTTIIIHITENFSPYFINLGPDLLICAGEQAELQIFNPMPGVMYGWSTGIFGYSTSVQPLQTTSYWVQGFDPDTGCEIQETITVEVEPVTVINMGTVAVTNCIAPCVTVLGQEYCAPGTYTVQNGPCETRIFTIGFEKLQQNMGILATLTCSDPCFEFLGQTYCSAGNFSVEDDCSVYYFSLNSDMAPPEVSAVVYQCLPSNTMFTVSFDVQGQGPVKVNGTTLPGSSFLSAPMPNGTNYSFVVEHAGNGCSTVVAGTYDCSQYCGNNPGLMVLDSLSACQGQSLQAAVQEPATAASGDAVLFVLHTSSTTIPGAILAVNNTGAFDFSPGLMIPGETYYVSQVVGPTLADGSIDWDNGCTFISAGQPFMYFPEPVLETVQVMDPACFGFADGQIAIQQASGAQPVQFALDDSDFSANTLYENLAAGTCKLHIQDANGCTADTLLVLIQPDSLWLDIGTDQTIAIGESVTLQAETNATTAVTAFWDSSNGLSQDGGLSWTVEPTIPTTYTGMVTDANGCTAEAAVFIQVEGASVYYPNAILKNAINPDNQFFTLFAPEGYVHQILSLEVYNRWGDQVFGRKNFPPGQPAEGWDGHTPDGSACPQDVYVFVARVELYDGQEEVITGDVTLIR